MRIVCPACEAEYDVPDSVAGSGRKVRCARCQTVWLATEAATAAVAEAPAAADADAGGTAAGAAGAPPEPASDAAPESAAPPSLVADPLLAGHRRRSGRPSALAELQAGAAGSDRPGLRGLAPWIAAWVLSLALIGTAAWAGYHWRTEVMRLWPASERLYAVLGSTAEQPPQRPGDIHALSPGGLSPGALNPGVEARDRSR